MILDVIRCAHTPQAKGSDQPYTLTEYASKFKKYLNQQRRASMPPPQKPLIHDIKMMVETTNKKEFVTHPITPRAKKPPVVYHPPEGTVDSTTEYNTKFQGKWAIPAQLIPPPRNTNNNTEPFNHTTSYAIDYVAPPVTPRQLYKSPNVYKPPKDTFEGSSTAQCDFIDYGNVPQIPSIIPPPRATVSTQPMEGITSYQSTFTAPTMPERLQKPKAIFVPSNNSTTTSKSDYPTHLVYKRLKSMKPSQRSLDNANVPFERNTTSRISYKTWELPMKFSLPPTVYLPPTESVSSQTTFKSDYPDYGSVPRAASFKPANKIMEQFPFESSTTQGSAFKVWSNIKKTEPIRRERKYEPPEERFDGMSTFKAHYKGACMPRTPSWKPPQKSYVQCSKMDSMTSYRENFSTSGYKPCPSASGWT